MDVAAFGSQDYLSTLVHELQHLVQFHLDGNDPHWFNEGLAQLAEHLCGFQVADFKIRHFLHKPDHRLHGWTFDGSDMSNYYGASFLFMLYVYERFGPEFIQDLASTEEDGLAAFANTSDENRQDMTIDEIFRDWILANYLDNNAIGSGNYGYKSLDLPAHIDAKPIISSTTDFEYSDSVHQYGADYLRLSTPGTYNLRFSGESEIAVVRATPPSGQWMWWSNDSSNGAARLTREVDLRDLKTATLVFDARWEIDDTHDWFHVLVSDDGGNHWQVVGGKRARGRNPRAPGKHYDGSSMIWVEEHIDLSPYAGRIVLVRFEYLTASAEPSAGLLLDNIGILELNAIDDVEKPQSAWQPEGFMRISETVSQNWTVSLIREFPEQQQPTVQHLDLDTANTGQVTIDVANGETVTLVIGAMAPFSQKRASYSLVLQQG